MDWKLVPAKQLDALSPQWDALQAKVLPHAFMRSAFLLSLLDQFGQGREHTRWTEDSHHLFHLTAYRWAGLKALQDRLNRSKTRAA